MKFKNKYSTVKNGDIVDHQYLISKNYKNCIICGDKTRFIEICSGRYLCSTECESEFYKNLECLINLNTEDEL